MTAATTILFRTLPSSARLRTWFAWIVCLAFLLTCAPLKAQGPPSKEYQVKVAYIYKIALYVNRGNNLGLTDGDRLTIGILGPDPFGRYLDLIAKKRKIHSKQIVVKRFASWQQYQPCDLLFISRNADQQSILHAQSASRGSSVLMVGEEEGFEQKGGVFNMYLDDSGKVGIKLNIDAANRNQFQIDARLLQVCDVVRDSAKPND